MTVKEVIETVDALRPNEIGTQGLKPVSSLSRSNSINNGSLRRRSAVDPAVRMALAPLGGPE